MAASRTLRAVLFDVDDTLYSTRDFATRARRNALEAMRRHGLRMSLDELTRELGEVVREFGSNAPNHYGMLLRRVPQTKYRGVNPAIIVAAAVKAYHDTKHRGLRPHADALRLLRRLRKTRLILGVVSDGLMVKQAEKLLRLGIYEFFDPSAIFISEQMGISKPNPKIYERACAALRVSPRRVLYVGNSIAMDIRPARKAGLWTAFVSRGAREDGIPAEAHHVVDDFRQLGKILGKDYGVRLS